MNNFRSLEDLRPVPVIRVGGEIGLRIRNTIDNNLLRLDIEKDFLEPFQKRDSSGGFIGLGKLVDAWVRLAGASDDDRVRMAKESLIRRILELQLDNGYIGMCAPAHRTWKLWDVHEMAFLVVGLVNDYRRFGGPGLEGAVRLTEYIMDALADSSDRLPTIDGFGSVSREMSYLGLDEALVALYEATEDPKYRDYLIDNQKLLDWDLPIVKGRHGGIEGHVYAFLGKCVAQLRLFRTVPDEGLLVQSRKAMDFLLGASGLTVTGAASYHECWHDTHDGGPGLGESCATAYLLWFFDELMQLDGKSCYGDVMERVIYNTLFAAQSPSGREIRYYTPFEDRRYYWGTDTYCCPNNYRRIVGHLPSLMYYLTGDGVAVNLYGDSELAISDTTFGRIKLTQRTDYPSSGSVRIEVGAAERTEFTIGLRIPAWANGATVLVGNAEKAIAEPGTYHTIRRNWQTGDTILIEMPMPTRFVGGEKAQAGRVALLRGPRVYCLNRTKTRAHQDQLAGADLRHLTIDPGTIGDPIPDDSVREGGTAIEIKAWTPAHIYGRKPNVTLRLSEFPDPHGEATFFLVPDPDARYIVPDELPDTS